MWQEKKNAVISHCTLYYTIMVIYVMLYNFAEHCHIGKCILLLGVRELKYVFNHPFLPELKEELGLCSRSVFGVEPSQMSFLFFLMYAAAAGGLLPLLESTSGSAQEFKIKVCSSCSLPECIGCIYTTSSVLK